MPPIPLPASPCFASSAETTSLYDNQRGCPQHLFLLKMILPFFQDNVPHGSPSITPGDSNKPQKAQHQNKDCTLSQTPMPVCLVLPQIFSSTQHVDNQYSARRISPPSSLLSCIQQRTGKQLISFHFSCSATLFHKTFCSRPIQCSCILQEPLKGTMSPITYSFLNRLLLH